MAGTSWNLNQEQINTVL